jgi:hypothetical protein
MRRAPAAVLIPLVLAMSACARPGTSADISPILDGSLAPGWRWESYGGVEVGVPGSWGWDNGAQRLSQWCVGPEGHTAKSIVGRPGPTTLAGCSGGKPDPSTLIANTGSVVAFGRTAEPPGVRISSLRLDGSVAEQAIREISKAPLGGGPNNPGDCLPSVSYGDDVVVLLVRSAAGRSEIVLRYSGCDHNGFDDGIAVRSLTAKAVAPFVARANAVLYGFSGGPEKMAILMPSPARR